MINARCFSGRVPGLAVPSFVYLFLCNAHFCRSSSGCSDEMALRQKNECMSGLNVSIIRRQSPRFKSGRMSVLRVSGDGQGFDGGY